MRSGSPLCIVCMMVHLFKISMTLCNTNSISFFLFNWLFQPSSFTSPLWKMCANFWCVTSLGSNWDFWDVEIDGASKHMIRLITSLKLHTEHVICHNATGNFSKHFFLVIVLANVCATEAPCFRHYKSCFFSMCLLDFFNDSIKSMKMFFASPCSFVGFNMLTILGWHR